MAGTATYPTGAIRDALERAAADGDLPASARRRELRTIRDELKHLAGYADTLLGDLALAEQRDALDEESEFRLMEDAAIREEMLKRGLATPEQLDELGLRASEEIAERRADGTLAEGAHADFIPWLHPRGRAGEFIDAFNPGTDALRFKTGDRVHWSQGGEHFEGNVYPGGAGEGKTLVDVGGNVLAMDTGRLAPGAAPPDPPRAEPKAPELPESMPPSREGDPLIAMGIDPLAAAGIRADEPIEMSSIPEQLRRLAEIEMGNRVRDAGELDDARRVARETWESWRSTVDVDPMGWKPPAGVTYSDRVAAIGSPADAEAYLRERGVDARLTPPDTAQGRNLARDTDFFRQIAQAVTDAQDKYPVLREGPHPLGTVALWSDSRQRTGSSSLIAAAMESIWGVTGLSVADPDANPEMHSLPLIAGHTEDARPEQWRGAKVDILLSDVNQHGFQSRKPWPDMGSAGPYALMTHELGHAAYNASGIQDADVDEHSDSMWSAKEALKENLSVDEAEGISQYALSGPGEAFAEVFAAVNVPGGLDRLPASTRYSIDGLRADLNKLTKWRVL